MLVRCLGVECCTMIEDSVSHGTCVHCVNQEAAMMVGLEICSRHHIALGEGDICWKCEEEFDAARVLMNLEMSKHQYSLWFVCGGHALIQCPVSNFDEAKLLYHSLNIGSVTGVRIARYDETESCESVLHKFC